MVWRRLQAQEGGTDLTWPCVFLCVRTLGVRLRRRYGTYKLVQKMPGGEKLTGFTRILHRSTPDELMDEVGGRYGIRYRG